MAQRQKEKEKQKASTSVSIAVAEDESKIVPAEEEDVNSFTVVEKLEVENFFIFYLKLVLQLKTTSLSNITFDSFVDVTLANVIPELLESVNFIFLLLM